MLEVGALSALDRADGGRCLGEIGDPRKGVGLDADGLPDIDWVEIPAGTFLYGDEREELELPAYRLSRYPVTNVQYQAFVDIGGYSEKRFWSADGWAWREEEGVSAPEDYDGYTLMNHPRVGVCWHEAAAFCRWLTTQVPYEVRLPRAAEWEKGARGTDGREFPWGASFDATRCNAWDTEIGRTSAVGVFVTGQSAYGLFDTCGNVWEWCESRPDELGHARALRGGAFSINGEVCRCANANWYPPSVRGYSLGFRLWSSVPDP